MVAELRWFSILLVLGALVSCNSTPTEAPLPPSAADDLSGEGQVRQQEGKVSVGTISRAQQAYFLENSKYAASLEDLDVALSPQYYDLEVVEVTEQQVIIKAIPKEEGLKSYIAGVSGIAQRIVCASDTPSKTIANPVFQREAWACAQGSMQVE
jgi:hypothetical protein